VGDVAESRIFAQTAQLEVILDAGVRAVKSLPLIGSKGQMLGMLSVHYRRPHRDSHGNNGNSASLIVLAAAIGLAVERRAGQAKDYRLPRARANSTAPAKTVNRTASDHALA
jgi:hypothetical protein